LTISGAAEIDRANTIGSLDAGKKGDVVFPAIFELIPKRRASTLLSEMKVSDLLKKTASR
jgi:hypothetical protein